MPINHALQSYIDNTLANQTIEVRRYRSASALQELYLPHQAPRAVAAGALEALYDDARATIGDQPLVYLEFGVYRGRSIARMVERFTHQDARFFGFDSFEGLPEDWTLPWKTMQRGAFTVFGRPPELADPRINFVKGWFQNTVPGFLDENRGLLSGPILVHFDADLYSSTLFLLATLWPKIECYYFIFDEFLEHECIALHDFSRAFPVKIDFYCQSNAGGLPSQVFGKITRVSLAIPAPVKEAALTGDPAREESVLPKACMKAGGS